MPRPDTSSLAPIDLSVHGTPRPSQGAAQRTRKGRLAMLLVWAVCAAPVVASYFTYYVVRPQGRTNYGTLITPTQAMPTDGSLSLADLQGHPVKAASLKGQWLLIVVSSGRCESMCERLLYLQRQLRETLGKDKDRLDRVWLLNDQAPVREALLRGTQEAWVLRTAEAPLARWLKPDPGQALGDHLYLVDPHGDWMMRFPANADPSRVKKDLARLMKASESWDEAGR